MAELLTLPEGAPIENRHISQLIDAVFGVDNHGVRFRLTGLTDDANYALEVRNHGAGTPPGKHFRVQHSTTAATLFAVTDDGIFAGATKLTFLNEVRGFYGNVADIPTGWTVIGQNAFVYGANADGDIGATGGTATHTHSHAHTQTSHLHAQTSHEHSYNFAHDHGGLTDDDNSNVVIADTGSGTDVSRHPHQHPIFTAGSGDRTTLAGTMTAANTGLSGAVNTGTDATAGSSLPPFLRFYWIRRTT